jgi:hypothetical protein
VVAQCVDVVARGDVVAQCGEVVAQCGEVVAQLFKASGEYQTEDAAVQGSNSALLIVSCTGQEI